MHFGPEEKQVRVHQFDDGDYVVRVGSLNADIEKTARLSHEVGFFVIGALADVDGMYFSDRGKAETAASFVQRYISEKYGLAFSLESDARFSEKTCP